MQLNKAFRFILFFYLISNPFFSFSQQWVQTRGPGGGKILDMLERNGTLLTTTPGGIFRSTDNGDTWVRSFTGFPEATGIIADYLDQTTNFVYAASASQGLYRSADNGITWSNVPVAIPNLFILELFVHNDVIYLGMQGSGVLRSTDEAASFQFINNGLTVTGGFISFAVVGNFLYGAGNGVYRTPINAINWQPMNNGLFTGSQVLDIAVKGTDLFITASNSSIVKGVFRSTDLGSTWVNVSPPMGFGIFQQITVYQGDVYTADDGNGIYKSTNDGASWTLMNNGLKPLTVFAFLPASNGLFAGFSRGIARTTDNATTWQLKNRGLTNTAVSSFYADGNTLYATTRSTTTNSGPADGVFYTTDAGQNWTPMNDGLFPNPEVNSLVKSGNNIIIATENYGVYVKTPTNTAFVHSNDIPISQVNALISIGPIVLAGATGEGEIYRSSDAGVTWVQSNTGTDNLQGDQIYCFYNKGGVIYAGGFNAIYKSADLGLTWTYAAAGISPGDNVNGITAIGNDLYAVTYTNGIYKSTNNGASWFNVNNGLPSPIHFNAIISANNILYSASDLGVYRSTNSGASWTDYNSGLLFKKNSLSLGIFNNQLVLGTNETAAWFQSSSVLPVKLINFTAAPVNNAHIKLNWTVAQESGITKYIAERAIAGTNNFTAIGSIASLNSPLQKGYEFIDRDITKNVLYQYRLHIAEETGGQYSEVRTAKISGNNFTISITPNPTTGPIKVLVNGYKGVAELTVINSVGQNVYAKAEKVDNNSTILIDISSRPKGVYIIKVKTPEKTTTEKVILN